MDADMKGNGQGLCCAPSQAANWGFWTNGTFARTSGQAHDYGGSIQAFGVTLGGYSTYSTSLRVDWQFDGSKGAWYSPTTASIIYAATCNPSIWNAGGGCVDNY